MKEYLTVGNAIAFILTYVAVNFYFLYQHNKTTEMRRLDTDRAVQALSEAIKNQQDIIETQQIFITEMTQLMELKAAAANFKGK